MNHVIYKFTIEESSTIKMPMGAKILNIGLQGTQRAIWALCNRSMHLVGRNIVVKWTGRPFDCAGLNYIGTVESESIVSHIFDGGEV